MLDLVKLAEPLEPVKFPDGSVHAVHPLDALGWELLRAFEVSGDEAQGVQLLHLIVPTATATQLASLGIGDAPRIMLYATRKIALVEDALKNPSGEAAPDPSTSPPSPPDTSPSTS